ncbi:MAG: NAD-dependent epimerase/dehydratase family protein [Planctomycetaceae bacterium]
MIRRVLVTGGAGFIGSHVVDALRAEGMDVRVLDSLLPGAHHGTPPWVRDDVEYVWADLRDEEALARAVEGIDAVSHQAAMVGLGVDLEDVTGYVSHNDLGTATLLRALHRSGFGGPLVLASSMVVYGEGTSRCATHGSVRPGARRPEDLAAGRFEPLCPCCGVPVAPGSVEEDAPLDPRNVYAATKVHQEHLCGVFGRERGSRVVVLRYHNVYGPRMPRDTPYAGVASIFRSALERGEPPRVFEDGRQLRDFVHVKDVARANLLAIGSDARGPFNVASGDRRTVLDMASALSDAFGPGAPRPEVVGGFRLGDVRHVVASPERATDALGFRAEVPFEHGIGEFATAPLR